MMKEENTRKLEKRRKSEQNNLQKIETIKTVSQKDKTVLQTQSKPDGPTQSAKQSPPPIQSAKQTFPPEEYSSRSHVQERLNKIQFEVEEKARQQEAHSTLT
ncbi:hypothetical protein JTB14_035803 [Gonioctena quinquepunctata]|nr:hypothetical protein JTB14_035803 [Gonioctena quinquepunctata]